MLLDSVHRSGPAHILIKFTVILSNGTYLRRGALCCDSVLETDRQRGRSEEAVKAAHGGGTAVDQSVHCYWIRGGCAQVGEETSA